MSKATLCSGIAAIVLAGTAVSWAQFALQPGEYELTSEMQLPGSSQTTRTTSVDCLSPAEAQDFQKLMMREFAATGSCEVSNVQTTADRVTFDTTCGSGGSRSTGSADITFGVDWYKAVVRQELSGARITSTVNAKRVGATCSNGE
jgi:Protein of unknown function (DUF3617)